MGKRKKIKLSDMTTTDANSLYAKLFFLNSHCGLRPTDIDDDDDDFARSVESQLSLEAKSLTCKYCSRVFHKRFGLSRHVESVHNEVFREEAARIKTTASRRCKKDVRDDVAKDRLIDDEDSEVEDEFTEPIDMKHAVQKGTSLPTFELQDWLVLESLSDFQPRVELRDVYLFEETALDLPDRESELDRIRRRKAIDPNTPEHIKVESSNNEGDEDEIAELAENAESDFSMCSNGD